ncbi:phospholipid carrier-dependent glycosyltransferase [Gordonia sp. SID5947]|uniref:ArnT family glycosyltransferase n=1 Tax=Gordonia sp. SID5947 TaxID=2690315 RepID=UPI00136AF7F9|nr:glycosyltransferase family 39 protein [Gordonia sp. SID5947]MYR07601.1 phospholipid carrier-dependent glycosyltransferase [Gordonia sp. SID5947]
MTTVLARPGATPPGEPPPPTGRHGRQAGEMPTHKHAVRWSPLALTGLLVTTAVLYFWNLAASGYANTFYAAAAQAGSQSWTAWFFGSLDSANFITVDKPPASLWVTGLSVRVFGMNSWAVLVPQALMGVAAVALLYCAMRRTFADPRHGTAAGLIAGAVLAFTPAAALMFRFNNPDALLVLLMVAAGYALTRAIATNSGRWLALVGVALGFAFLTKMLQGLLVLPAFGLAYLMFADNGWLKRIGHLIGATVALIVSAGWFVVATILVPASARPYIGGSTDNTFMDLVWGYNGVGRISGGGGAGGGGGPGGGQAGGSFGGSTGLNRLFSSEMGNEISWLLPVALLALGFAIYLGLRSFPIFRFTDGISRVEGGAVVAWGGWLVITGLIFSFMSGTIHPYYTVALAPAIGAMVGMGGVFAWRRRDHWDGRIALAAMIGLAGWWSIVLLNRNDFGPVWCRWLIGALAAISVAALLVGSVMAWRKAVAGAVIIGALAGAGGSVGFAIATAATAHNGSIPTAVNTAMESGGMGGPGGGTPPSMNGQAQNGQTQNGQTQNGQTQNGPTAAGGKGQGQGRSGRAGMGGGMGGDVSSNTELVSLLKSSGATWSAATNGSQSASGIEIATGTAVMAIGGWSGDPAPTLQQFIDYVKAGKIGYYIGGGQGGPGGNSEISTWVAQNYTATTVGGTTVYKLN